MSQERKTYAGNSRSVRGSLRLVLVAGALAMVFFAGIGSPLYIKFLRAVGATEFHIGLIGGIPMAVLMMQFVGAMLASRLRHRKPLFMFCIIAGRFLYLPIVCMPLLFPSASTDTVMLLLIMLIAISGLMRSTVAPLWYSWMADVIPRRILGAYWGSYHALLQVAWMVSSLAVAGFAAFGLARGLPITVSFPVLVAVCVTAGITDIVLFLWVKEPAHEPTHGIPLLQVLLTPLRDVRYRKFLLFVCTRFAGVMFAASFMQVYAMEQLGLSESRATLVWCTSGLGMALAARGWGRVADKHGHKPVMAICTFFKPIIALVFVFLTKSTVLWLLPLMFLIDGFWNAGNRIAEHGYMMRVAPKENRSMFIAAILGLSGLCAGLASVAGGIFLETLEGVEFIALGKTWTNYHLLFLVSFVVRALSVMLVHRVSEPKSSKPIHVLNDFMGLWPLRLLRFPVGMYQNSAGEGLDSGNEGKV